MSWVELKGPSDWGEVGFGEDGRFDGSLGHIDTQTHGRSATAWTPCTEMIPRPCVWVLLAGWLRDRLVAGRLAA